MSTGIYKIENPEGLIYIGQSIDLDRRLNEYRKFNCKSQYKLYASIKRYGWDKHKFSVICECEEHELNEKERMYQDTFQSVETGLNCIYTSTDTRSGKLGEETKLKMSRNRIGHRDSEITRQRKSESAIIAQNKPETKLKKSESLKLVQNEVQNRPDVKRKKSESGKIAQNRPETRLKKSLAIKGRVSTCVHCGKTGGIANMTRYHFDNCRLKTNH